MQVPKNPYYKFYKSVGHNEEECRSFSLMRERTYDAYRVQNDAQGNGYRGSTSVRGTFGGHGHGGIPGRGRGQVVCYNGHKASHLARDC